MAESLTQRTIKNNVYSLIGFIWPLVLSFVAAPIIIRGLGSAKFGFFSLLNTMMMLFGLLDFGISYTLTQAMSAKRQQPEGEELSSLLGSTLTLYAIIGTAVMVVLFLLPGTFQHLFKIPSGFISSFTAAFFIVGLVFFLNMVSIPFVQIPYALQRSDIGVKISLVSNAILEIGSIVAIKTGHGILSLLIIQLVASIFLFFSMVLVWRHLAPKLRLRLQLPWHVIATIGRQGFWVFFSNTMGNILAQLDKFVLGAMWGPAAVGYYSTAQMIPEKISGTSISLSNIFFPVFAEAATTQQEGEQKVKKIFRRSLGIIPVITAGLATLVLIYGYQLIYFWVSKDFADHTSLAVPLLAVTYFFLGFGSFFNAFLSGLKALKFLALSSMIVAVVDVIFMFILIPGYGVNGAAFAYLLSGLPMLGFLYYIERHYFNSSRKDIIVFYSELFAKILSVSALIFLAGLFLLRPLATNLAMVMVLGALTFGLYLLAYWLLGFYMVEDMALFKVYLGRFVSFFKKIKT